MIENRRTVTQNETIMEATDARRGTIHNEVRGSRRTAWTIPSTETMNTERGRCLSKKLAGRNAILDTVVSAVWEPFR